jgi:signal transduction histidine kinase
MRRVRLERVWLFLALALLALGVWAWWRSSPADRSVNPEGFMLALWVATGVIVTCSWRRSAAAKSFDAPFMAPLALAASAPLAMVPLAATSGAWAGIAYVLATVAALPLGWSLLLRVVGHDRRRVGVMLLVALGAASIGWSLVGVWLEGDAAYRLARWTLVALITAIPAVQASADALRAPRREPASAQQRLVEALVLLAIGFAPPLAAVSLVSARWPLLLLPAFAAALTALVLVRFVIRPFGRLGSRAVAERDQVVAAMETERSRLASVLHDGPLADITLLIQRLDDRGDADGAAVARSIASELRSIGSELRLPILDDLGAGPALEWLVGRMSQRTGSDVHLEHSTVARPPAPVELAAYRVAQEALVNAVKHGASPITVRYRATPQAVTLSVDDAGPGLEPGAPIRAEREGRLGLASMAHRAEAIGARLALAVRPEGGTHVELEWRALPAASA